MAKSSITSFQRFFFLSKSYKSTKEIQKGSINPYCSKQNSRNNINKKDINLFLTCKVWRVT